MRAAEDTRVRVRSSFERSSRPLSGLSLGFRPTRRQFLLAMGFGLIGAACTGGGRSRGSNSGPSGSIAALAGGATALSLVGSGADAPPTGPGKNRFGFALVDQQDRALVGGSPQVWIAQGPNSKAIGPFPATWYPFTAYQKTQDRSPESPLPGDFTAEVDFPSPGNWTVAVIVRNGPPRSPAPASSPSRPGRWWRDWVPEPSPLPRRSRRPSPRSRRSAPGRPWTTCTTSRSTRP